MEYLVIKIKLLPWNTTPKFDQNALVDKSHSHIFCDILLTLDGPNFNSVF